MEALLGTVNGQKTAAKSAVRRYRSPFAGMRRMGFPRTGPFCRSPYTADGEQIAAKIFWLHNDHIFQTPSHGNDATRCPEESTTKLVASGETREVVVHDEPMN